MIIFVEIPGIVPSVNKGIIKPALALAEGMKNSRIKIQISNL